MKDKKKPTEARTSTYSIRPPEALALKRIAFDLGFPSASALLRAIANKEGVKVVKITDENKRD